MLTERRKLVRLSSWLLLFFIQVIFFIFPIFDFWMQVSILASFMLLSTILWIRIFEKRSLKKELNPGEKGLALIMYMFLAVILFFFTKNSFREATLLTGGSLIIPLFEELFFRKYLLGSMVNRLPRIRDLPNPERIKLFRKSFIPLTITSLMFALVHSDVIASILNGPFIFSNLLTIIVLRMLFSVAVGGLYIIERKWIVPTIFHITFNMSYFIFN